MTKRKRRTATCSTPNKRARVVTALPDGQAAVLLRQYFTNVCTLRQYLLCRLPNDAKRRKKQLRRYGEEAHHEADVDIKHLLDTVFVGSHKYVSLEELAVIDDEITLYTQQTVQSTVSKASQQLQQAEIIDFCIWKLQQRNGEERRATHLLSVGASLFNRGVPDPQFERVQTLRRHPWTSLTSLLGRSAERILCDMFLECGIFVPATKGGNMIQLSGIPLTELKTVVHRPLETQADLQAMENPRCKLSDIRILRHRMLYSRQPKGPGSWLRWSLGQAHVLARYNDIDSIEQCIHVAKYIFPHQFGLRNVFTGGCCSADEDREAEIAQAAHRSKHKLGIHISTPARLRSAVPKRMRQGVVQLVRKIRSRYKRSAIGLMFNHYCPRIEASNNSIEAATPHHQVSAFCRAALLDVFGVQCFGVNNRQIIMAKVDHFIRIRRYESITMHELLEDISIRDIQWLTTSELGSAHMSRSDFDKRKELLAEVLYFVFDSFLIPLIRAHFHVTESTAHRNKLFYFRHDIWTAMCEPALQTMKTNMLEECSAGFVEQAQTSRSIGINCVRMIPKEVGMRPVINLRRRITRQQHGKTIFARSVNSLLQPAFQAMNFERSIRPHLVGNSMFSVDDMLPQLQAYRQSLKYQGIFGRPLYFAKVDVQGCFDSLPQTKLMELVRTVLERDEYSIKKFSRVKLLGGRNEQTPGFGAKPSSKFLLKACERSKQLDLEEIMTAEDHINTIYIDGRPQAPQSRSMMLNTLQEHIECNLVKVGNRVYRQKRGIAQGSIASSLLCNLLYTQMEHDLLPFANTKDTKLLRMIDDILLITPQQEIAEQFMHIMHAGIEEYGIHLKLEKSRTNFDMSIGGRQVSSLSSTTDFPFCGQTINTSTLDIGKDADRVRSINAADTVTVEYSKLAGQSFYRKTLNAMQVQMHKMLISTMHNALETVLCNLYKMFCNVAQKTYWYVRSMPKRRQPSEELIIRMINDSIKLAQRLVHRCRDQEDNLQTVGTAQTRWSVLPSTSTAAWYPTDSPGLLAKLSWTFYSIDNRSIASY